MEQVLTGFLDKSAQLRKRATAKGLTIGLVKQLVELNSPLYKSYKRTFYCSSVIRKEGKTLTSTYCNNRWCYVCNRIKTARMIEGYEPILNQLPELRFVTLTRPNVKGEQLKDEIEELISGFRKIRDKLRKHRILIKGIRKLEITHNIETDEFHPHFHCAVSGDFEAQCLVTEWLAQFPTANRGGQDNRPADVGSLKELFKYCSKISENPPEVNDVIFRAIRGKRLIQSMGGIRQVSEDIEKLQAEDYSKLLPENDDIFIWTQKIEDWISTEDGYYLIGELEANNPKNVIQLYGGGEKGGVFKVSTLSTLQPHNDYSPTSPKFYSNVS